MEEKNNANPHNEKSIELKRDYQKLIEKIRQYFPKVDEILVLDLLRMELEKKDWEGSTTLEIRYADEEKIKLEEKKEILYKKFDMLPQEKDENTLRFKAKGMYLSDVEELIDKDKDIDHIIGSAKPTEEEQYPSTH